MQFLKKHYEKILLGFVLVGLGAVAVALVFMVANDKDAQAARTTQVTTYTPKPLDPPKTDEAEAMLKVAEAPLNVEFSDNTNKLFNPLRWQMHPTDRSIFPNPKESELAPLEILNIRPLLFTVTYLTNNVTDLGAHFGFEIVDGGVRRGPPKKTTVYLAIGESKDVLKLASIKGTPNAPTELEVELADTGEKVAITREKPYQRVTDHVADLRYPPQNLTFKNCRANDPPHDRITINGTTYNIVYITDNSVVLSAPSHKKTTKYFTPASH